MKNLLLPLLLILTLTTTAQVPKTELLFDVSALNSDTVTIATKMGRNFAKGLLDVQYSFEDFDCITSKFDVAVSLMDDTPAYIKTSGEIELPIALDTTAVRDSPFDDQPLFSRYQYEGENKWTFYIMFEWNAYWLYETIIVGSGCTEGKIYRAK